MWLIILLSPAVIAAFLIEASKHKSTYLGKGLRVLVPVNMKSYIRKNCIFSSAFCSCVALLLTTKIFNADGVTEKSSSTTGRHFEL